MEQKFEEMKYCWRKSNDDVQKWHVLDLAAWKGIKFLEFIVYKLFVRDVRIIQLIHQFTHNSSTIKLSKLKVNIYLLQHRL